MLLLILSKFWELFKDNITQMSIKLTYDFESTKKWILEKNDLKKKLAKDMSLIEWLITLRLLIESSSHKDFEDI